jgi:hypothetical protein
MIRSSQSQPMKLSHLLQSQQKTLNNQINLFIYLIVKLPWNLKTKAKCQKFKEQTAPPFIVSM